MTKVVCLGEILWDCLPDENIEGGSLLNISVALKNLGVNPIVLSAVGNDPLGSQLLQFIGDFDIDLSPIHISDQWPTGTVTVTFESGEPQYTINANVAYDHLYLSDNTKTSVYNAKALIFGSLSLRSIANQNLLDELLKKYEGLVFFDANFRIPFTTFDILKKYLPLSDIFKVNKVEWDILIDWFGIKEVAIIGQVRQLKSMYPNINVIIITNGEKGSTAFENDNIYFQKAANIEVQDTIGCGDSFSAGFIQKYLENRDIAQSLSQASSVSAFVATQKGGTPRFKIEDLN